MLLEPGHVSADVLAPPPELSPSPSPVLLPTTCSVPPVISLLSPSLVRLGSAVLASASITTPGVVPSETWLDDVDPSLNVVPPPEEDSMPSPLAVGWEDSDAAPSQRWSTQTSAPRHCCSAVHGQPSVPGSQSTGEAKHPKETQGARAPSHRPHSHCPEDFFIVPLHYLDSNPDGMSRVAPARVVNAVFDILFKASDASAEPFPPRGSNVRARGTRPSGPRLRGYVGVSLACDPRRTSEANLRPGSK